MNPAVDFTAMCRDFGTDATLMGGASVRVLLDSAYQGALGGLMESAGPQCVGKSSDLAAVEQGSTLTIDSVQYQVASVQPDGTGITTLVLELV